MMGTAEPFLGELNLAFEVDFTQERLGRPHHMKFTANPQRVASLTGASLR